MFRGAQFNYSIFIRIENAGIFIPLIMGHSGRERPSKPLTSNPALDCVISRSRFYEGPLYVQFNACRRLE